MYLPKDVEREYFIPDPTILFHGDLGALIRAPQEYPETELYNILKISCYPDPPDYHIARFKDWIRFVDPNLFPDGALKEAINERTYFYLKDRDSIVKSYCKQNHLKLSSFPRPVLTSEQEQKFGNCGPEQVWIDKVDRWFRQIDVPLAWSIRLAMIILLIMLVFFLNLPPVAPFGDQVIILAFNLLIGIAPIEIIIEYFTCKFILRRARQEPFIWPMDLIDLHWLLRELSDFRHMFTKQAAVALKITELAHATTTIHRSRPHPNKKAYSIKIVSEVALTSKTFSAIIKPEKMRLTVEVIGESINGPHIVLAWFDAPKSFLLAKSAIKIINYERDELCRLLCCRLDFHTDFIAGRKINSGDEERDFLQYWPVFLKNYHARTKIGTLPAQLYSYQRKSS